MGLFKVGPQFDEVEVYVHNRYEHFKRTVSRMDIKGKVSKTVQQIQLRMRSSTSSISKKIIAYENLYLSYFNMKSKDEYYREFNNAKKSSDNEVIKAMYDFVDIAPKNVKELKNIILRRFGENVKLTGKGAKERTKQALNKLYDSMKSENDDFYQNSNKFFTNLLAEYDIVQNKDAKKTSDDSISKRVNAYKESVAKMKLKKAPETVAKAQKQAAQARKGTDGFGVSYEPLAGAVVQSVNSFISGAIRQGPIEVVADKNYDKNYTTDVKFPIMDLTVGIDVKSNKVIYKKTTGRQGYGYELLSSIYLGKGGFAELGSSKNFGGILLDPDPEFLKKLTYILVNATVFADSAGGLKSANEAEQGLRTLFVVAGLMDFIVIYISKAINDSRSQLLIMAGDEIIFTTDFIDKMIEMIEKIKPETGKLYGINYKLLEEGKTNMMPEGLKTQMLKHKLSYVRKGVNTYAELFTKVGSKEMKQITSKALQRSMEISINVPLSKIFEKRSL